MSDPTRGPPITTRPATPPPAATPDGTTGHPAAAAPTTIASPGGRARAFRQAEARRRTARRERTMDLVLVVVVVFGAYTVLAEPANSLLTGNGLPNVGPPVLVTFGTLSVAPVTCGSGGTAYAERIPWVNSTRPVTTGDVYVEVYAIFDGDIIGRANAVANATPSNLCSGAPPDPVALWYVVLEAPNGTNLFTYTPAGSWTSVTHGSNDVEIENGSTLVLVTSSSLAGTGRGLKVFGFVDDAPIMGAVAL